VTTEKERILDEARRLVRKYENGLTLSNIDVAYIVSKLIDLIIDLIEENDES